MTNNKPQPDAETELEAKNDQPAKAEIKKDSGSSKNPLIKAKTWFIGLPRREKFIYGGGLAIILLVAIIAATSLRYPVVGLVHKGTLEIALLDESTGQPIPDADIEVGGRSGKTDKSGKLVLAGLPLGSQRINITKEAYRPATQQATFFLRRVKLGTVKLNSIGLTISFSLKNWVTGEPVEGAEVAVANTSAISNAQGIAKPSVIPGKAKGAKATIKKSGFNDAQVTLGDTLPKDDQTLTLTPSGKVYFLSNSDKVISLYRSNLDSTEREVVVAGTGSEDAETGILPNVGHPEYIAFVSSREGRRDTYGSPKHDLYLVNGETKSIKKINSDVAFANFRAWVEDSLVYLKTAADGRGELRLYDVAKGTDKQLVLPTGASGYGPATVSVLGAYDESIFYSVYADDAAQKGFYAMDIGGSTKKISGNPASEYVVQSKDAALVNIRDESGGAHWSRLQFADKQFIGLGSGPSITTSRTYVDSPSEKFATFIEERDGKSELYLSGHDGSNEKKVTSVGGVNQFVQWYGDNYVVYSSDKEGSALFIVATTGGDAKKITDFFQGNGRTYSGGYNPQY